jgi:soluble lytic murein transglycosylase-like protein
MLMLPISISAQEGKFDWNPVMDAIIQVESKGNPKAHNKNGDCAGILQITPGLVKQCNTWLKAKKSKKRYTLSDRYNVKKSKEMFVMVQKHYNKSNNVEKAIRVWNGGPGYTLEGTNGYYRKVMKYYKKKGAE